MSIRFQGPCLFARKARDFSFRLLVTLPAASFAEKIGLFILLPALGMAGCVSNHPRDQLNSLQRTINPTMVTYTDEIGRKVELPKRPLRIISLAMNVTETLYLLGAQDRLIGNTVQCNWPEEAKNKLKIGDLLNPNYEMILDAKPDLIIASTAGNDQGSILKLIDFGLPVYVTAPRSVEKIFESIENIGRITDCSAQGNSLVVQMRNRLEAVRQRIADLPPTRAFFITWFDPLLAPGKNTFETTVLRLAGVHSITADIPQYYPRYSLEQVLVQNPEVILTVGHEGKPLPDLKKVAGWQTLSAVKEGKVYILSEVIQHPSPRFVDGVEELAKKLHPERFP